jgi:hypothetical protein
MDLKDMYPGITDQLNNNNRSYFVQNAMFFLTQLTVVAIPLQRGKDKRCPSK